MILGPIRRRHRWLWRLLVFTIAWQAFAYGWSITTASYVERWPQVNSALDFYDAWTADRQAPLTHLLDWTAGWLAAKLGRPGWLHVHLMAYCTFLLHAFLVSLGLVIAGREKVHTTAPFWGYILSAWNPFLMVQVVYHQWPLMLASASVALAFLWTLKARWTFAASAFWLSTLVDARLVMLWPVVFAPLWAGRRRKRFFLYLVPGLVLWIGFAISVGWKGWWTGVYRMWWGQESWQEIGWSAFSFMRLVPLDERWAGFLSLGLVLALNVFLAYAFVRRWVTLRMLAPASAMILWLFYWRSQFFEVGLALYWIGIWFAHHMPTGEIASPDDQVQAHPAQEHWHAPFDRHEPADLDE